MAEQQTNAMTSSQDWVTIKDEESDLEVSFPNQPLDITFDVPFQNTPPQGQLKLYSTATQTGVFILSVFRSPEVNASWLEHDPLKEFFEKILVPHLFYDPSVFRNEQTFDVQLKREGDPSSVSFQIHYLDRGMVKRVEGEGKIKNNALCLYFHLASEDVFDSALLHQFVESVH